MKLVRLTDADLRKNDIPYSKWGAIHLRQKHPELFVKLNGKIFLIKEKWEEYIQKEYEKQAQKIRKIRGQI